jgi:hypothetical protein
MATTPPLTVDHHQVFDFGAGCVCCSPDGDLARLLAALNATQQQRLELQQHRRRPPSSTPPPPPPPPPFTHLFLETTGVADVHPFVQVIRNAGVGWSEPIVLCLVHSNPTLSKLQASDTDPANFERILAQAKASDVLVLNTNDGPTASTVAAPPLLPLHTMSIQELVQHAAALSGIPSTASAATSAASSTNPTTPTNPTNPTPPPPKKKWLNYGLKCMRMKKCRNKSKRLH